MTEKSRLSPSEPVSLSMSSCSSVKSAVPPLRWIVSPFLNLRVAKTATSTGRSLVVMAADEDEDEEDDA